MAIIKTEGIHKSFGKVHALAGIDLEIDEGEIYGFIGPNGAGKSTLIRVLLGVLKADAGMSQIFGLDTWKDAVEIHKRIAYVPGDVNLWPNLSGGEVIDLFLRMKGEHDKSYREELIRDFDFDPTKKCGTYSKGNRQKVALIAAFSSDADLYIFDEPTSGLDPLMENVFRNYVKKEKDKGKSIFLSSHILSEVEQLCEKISIIKQGKIVDSGTLEDMRHITRNHVLVETDEQVDKLAEINGVHDVKINDANDGTARTVEFSMDNSETSTVLNYLASLGINRIVSTPPTLEELFMSHYDR